jgi:hypothetical protein
MSLLAILVVGVVLGIVWRLVRLYRADRVADRAGGADRQLRLAPGPTPPRATARDPARAVATRAGGTPMWLKRASIDLPWSTRVPVRKRRFPRA